ncbi:MAG: hypothetical protein JNK75_06220 [Betaproteobacteria bacterium]|nr:hypothetical protein [Betaproteobacteria bacterium]
MTLPAKPVAIQFAKAGNLYRLDVCVSPLIAREIPQVVEIFTAQWAKPVEVERAKVKGAQALALSAEHELRAGERAADIARTLSYAIWKKLDRYVKVTVEATYLGESQDGHYEFGEVAYTEAFGARFEN